MPKMGPQELNRNGQQESCHLFYESVTLKGYRLNVEWKGSRYAAMLYEKVDSQDGTQQSE